MPAFRVEGVPESLPTFLVGGIEILLALITGLLMRIIFSNYKTQKNFVPIRHHIMGVLFGILQRFPCCKHGLDPTYNAIPETASKPQFRDYAQGISGPQICIKPLSYLIRAVEDVSDWFNRHQIGGCHRQVALHKGAPREGPSLLQLPTWRNIILLQL